LLRVISNYLLTMKYFVQSLFFSLVIIAATPVAAQTVISFPDFATPKGSELVGVNLQNPTGSTIAAGPVQFGQAFVEGDLSGSSGVELKLDGKTVPAQIDVKNRYPDGSVRFGIISLIAPELRANTANQAVIAPASKAGGAVSLADLSGYSFVVTFKIGAKTHTFDIPALFARELGAGRVSYWRQGPVVTEGRIDVPVESSLRLVVDLAKYSDGTYITDVAVRNDHAMTAQGGTLIYDVSMNQNGREVLTYTALNHYQYGAWRKVFSTTSERPVNVQIDTRYTRETNAIPYYDVEMGLDAGVIDLMKKEIAKDPEWGKPFNNAGIQRSMGNVGGRPDIGPHTKWGASWLVSQHPVAAQFALDQANAAAGVPWHMWDVANKTWLNLENYPKLWTDPRGGKGTPGDPNSGSLTQYVAPRTQTAGWAKDESHRPQLSFLPYLFTGQRFHLDELMASAHDHFMTLWPAPRKSGEGRLSNQVRGRAWAMRDVAYGAWAAPDGTTEQRYLQKFLNKNLDWYESEIPMRTAQQGEVHGYIVMNDSSSGFAAWQNDWFIGSMSLIALHGYPQAKRYIEWATNYHAGRFLNEANGFNPRDGVLEPSIKIGIPIKDAKGLQIGVNYIKTWREVGELTRTQNGGGNGTGWTRSNGYYGRTGMFGLASIINITNSPEARTARAWLAVANPPGIGISTLLKEPSMRITLDPRVATGVTRPLLSLTASAPRVASGAAVTLVWSAAGASTCSGSGMVVTTTSGSVTVNPLVTTTYGVNCSGTGGTVSRTVTVEVGTSTGGVIATSTGTTTPPKPPVVSDSTHAKVTLVARPSTVKVGERTTLTWTSSGARSCEFGGFTPPTVTTSGSFTVTPLITTTYSVVCTSSSSSAAVRAEVAVTVATSTSSGQNNSGNGDNGGTMVIDPNLSRPVTPPAYHSRGFTAQIGATVQSLTGTITLPSPTVTSAPKAWSPKLQGTAGVDVFQSLDFGGNPRYISSGGNDVFYMPGITSTGFDGLDANAETTVVASQGVGTFKMPDHIKQVVYQGTPVGSISIRGNSRDNILISQPKGSRGTIGLNGGLGDDILVAGPLRDEVVIDKDGGTDTVIGFNTAASGGDIVRLYPGAYTSYRELASALRQVGSDTVLVMKNSKELWFKNTSATAFTPAHFAKLSSDWGTGQVRGVSTDVARFLSRLSLRSSGEEVRLLQVTLAALGYYDDENTGYFGPKTEAAVRSFQVEHAVDSLGIVGPITRTLLNGALDAE
jgi:Putative peptidoglycan binding domain